MRGRKREAQPARRSPHRTVPPAPARGGKCPGSRRGAAQRGPVRAETLKSFPCRFFHTAVTRLARLAEARLRGLSPSTTIQVVSPRIPSWLVAGVLSLLAPLALPVQPATEDVRFGRDVRPILSDHCFECHGADAESRAARLRLDQRESAVRDRGGYAAIAPGDLEASELWARVTDDDPDWVMPPPAAKKPALTEAELDVLRRWIEAGAEYEPHWAFVAPTRPELPEVRDAAWPRDEVDAFVLARLEAEGLGPSEEADRATLLRRLFLTTTGLPPSVEELEAFLADTDPDAYERVVERVFTEEPYRTRMAEHLATPWLDLARYADTCGIHQDNGRQAWHWRDWVLEALREDMPYDRFVTEQLAGDLLPDATVSQLVASGFHRNQVTTDEGGAIDEEYLVEYAVERASTTGTAFLGLTVGCARCHDHKFDPLTQEDFYSFYAFFNSIEQPGLYSQTQDANRAYEPFIEVPSEAQLARQAELAERLAELEEALAAPLPGEDDARAAFDVEVHAATGVRWTTPAVLDARSSAEGVELDAREDGVLVASGPMPASEDYVVELATDEAAPRLLLLEALSISEEHPGAGRADHGNAVLSHLTLEARPRGGGSAWSEVPLSWAWADHVQPGNDFQPVNVLHEDARGWPVDGNADAGPRTLLLLAEQPFGFAGGAELRVTLAFRSPYDYHSLGRIRFRVSPLASAARLPVARGRWYSAGSYPPATPGDRASLYDDDHGPGAVAELDLEQRFGEDQRRWTFEDRLRDGEVVRLADGQTANYVARELWAPEARALQASFGSDDGLIVHLNGARVFERRVDRGAAPDQDLFALDLEAGRNTLVLRVVNTGGPSGYYFDPRPTDEVLVGELPAALLPEDAVTAEEEAELREGWRRRFFTGYRTLDDEARATRRERDELTAALPRAMVMRERAEPREAFVLMRGQYDAPDPERPVRRTTPGFLPPFPEDAPRDRLGLARWLTSAENPLFARVAVNQLWQGVFGRGLVATPEDFGLQGAWPSHPELLDWLAVELRGSGWSRQALLRRLVLSSTFRQASRVRPEVVEVDPEGALLASFPRRRLSAEVVRDLALHASGLLVEELGGRSVKPYQPEGLWREVAMPSSNTRTFERGTGEDLWRRSLYTYWKRAVPPPSLQTLDAPTRESCVVRRQTTNTPLQALVLWNDEQFVEAARVLAARALTSAEDDLERLRWLMLTVTSRAPEVAELELFAEALEDLRARYRDDEDAARELLAVGAAPAPMDVAASELAAWTLLASAALNLHETLTLD